MGISFPCNLLSLFECSIEKKKKEEKEKFFFLSLHKKQETPYVVQVY